MPDLKAGSGGVIYYNLSRGFFRRKSDESNPDAVKRTLEDGTVRHEIVTRGFEEVIIVDIEKTIKEYKGKKKAVWEVSLLDGEQIKKFTMAVKSSTMSGLMFSLPNIALEKEVNIVTFLGSDDKTVLWVQQKDENGTLQAVKRYWTKDNPGKLPPMEKDELGDWNSAKQAAYLERYVIKRAKPKMIDYKSIKKNMEAKDTPPPDLHDSNPNLPPDAPDESLDSTDDLPF